MSQMATEEIQIPAAAATTYKTLAEWVRKDLCQRQAHTLEWEGRVIYRLPETVRGEHTPSAAVRVGPYATSALSVMPEGHGDLPGVWVKRDELERPVTIAAHRLRVVLMRVSRDARQTAARIASRTP